MSEEIWKPVEGWCDRYEVSNTGRVRTVALMSNSGDGKLTKLKEYRIRNVSDDGAGYMRVGLCLGHSVSRLIGVHRLVALAFLGPCPFRGAVVNHKNNIRADNRVENLEWVSHQGNRQHAVECGRAAVGERHGSAKLTVDKVIDIKKLKGKFSGRQIAKSFGIHYSTVSAIFRGRLWASKHSLTNNGRLKKPVQLEFGL